MENLIEKYKDRLPRAYLDFINNNQGFEGYLGDDFGYVDLWDINELHESWNGYEFHARLSDEWFPIGSNLGGEIIVIKISSPRKELLYIPFIPMSDKYAEPYCDDFSKLYNAIRRYLAK